jgi:hypothetical protein
LRPVSGAPRDDTCDTHHAVRIGMSEAERAFQKQN